MKQNLLVLVALFLFGFGSSSWGVCPEDEWDFGECDTMYVEPWADDLLFVPGEGPYFVRVPFYATCDVFDECDSIAGFVIPLCYEQKTNVSKYCSVSAWWNTTNLTGPPVGDWKDRTIFRHLVSGNDTTYNWQMARQEEWLGGEWDTRILDLYTHPDSAHFWLAMFPTGIQDHRFEEGSRILLATMTFKLEDSMSICIDTCFWPPGNRLAWSYGCGTDTHDKIPRPPTGGLNSFEVCFNLAPFSNNPPDSFSLLFPPKKAFTPRKVRFDWETATDPDSSDQVMYDLYVSTSYHFSPDSTTIDADLVASEHIKTLDYGAYYWKVKAKDNRGAERWSNQTRYFMVTGIHPSTIGDLNLDGSIDVGDVVFFINYLYKSGPAPDPLEVGDCNCDGVVGPSDVVYLLNYLFRGGPAPCR